MRTPMIIMLACMIASSYTQGQSANLDFDNQFQFTDGIYLNYYEFINNKPSFRVDEVRIKETDSKFFNKRKIKSIKYRDKDGKKQTLDMNKVWGICLDQIPYIQYQVVKNLDSSPYAAKRYTFDGDFTRIRILGNICHFNIEDVFSRGNGYFDGNISSDTRALSIQKILKMETGEVRDFTPYYFKNFIKDDEALYNHFISNIGKQEEKLFLYLQKYNERNPYSLALN